MDLKGFWWSFDKKWDSQQKRNKSAIKKLCQLESINSIAEADLNVNKNEIDRIDHLLTGPVNISLFVLFSSQKNDISPLQQMHLWFS